MASAVEVCLTCACAGAQGETVTMYPVPAFNQLMLTVNSTDGVCMFAQNFVSGSLLGLPTEVPVRPSKAGVRFCRLFPRIGRSASLHQHMQCLVERRAKENAPRVQVVTRAQSKVAESAVGCRCWSSAGTTPRCLPLGMALAPGGVQFCTSLQAGDSSFRPQVDCTERVAGLLGLHLELCCLRVCATVRLLLGEWEVLALTAVCGGSGASVPERVSTAGHRLSLPVHDRRLHL